MSSIIEKRSIESIQKPRDFLNEYTESLIEMKSNIIHFANKAYEQVHNSRYIFFVGNGASATMAEHYAADWTNNAGLSALTLNSPSRITSLGNDISFDHIFSYSLQQFGTSEDLLIAISGSGNSTNIIESVKVAQQKQMQILALTGFNSNNWLFSHTKYHIRVPSKKYGIIESIHNVILHTLTDMLVFNYQSKSTN